MPATYTPELLLQIDGKDASKELLGDILQVSVEESLHLPGMFTIVVRNSAKPGRRGESIWQHESWFAIGKKMKIGFTNATTKNQDFQQQNTGYVLEGEITAIETHFTAGAQAPLIVRGYDASHRLHRGHYNRSFQNMTDSDIVKKIAGEVGISPGTIDDSGQAHEYVFQENQTNMEFLRERAARNGFELFIQDGKLNFRAPKQDQALTLKWLKELTSFQVRVSSAEQVQSVEVRGWDFKQKKEIVSTSSRESILTSTQFGKGANSSTAFAGKPPTPKLILSNQPVATTQEADKLAKALFHELSDSFVRADAQAIGNPTIRPGRVVTLKDSDNQDAMLGKYAGKYYITDTHHQINEGVYTTAFSIRGLRGGDLLSVLSPHNQLQAGQTLMIGLVTNNNDPDGLGRVRVKFPTLTIDHESQWARVVAIGAGTDRGFDCLPEINDEVLVGFEHGDIHRPFVIGGLWNGKDKPPTAIGDSVSSSKVRLRTFKSRVGHTIQLIDEDKTTSKKGVHIKTSSGHEIYLNETDKIIKIRTAGGHLLEMNDMTKSVSLTSTNSLSIKATTISVEATGTLDLKASGVTTVKGAMIKLN